MINRLLALLDRRPPSTAATVGAPFARRDIAVAALLLELAQIDRRVPPAELAAVERVVRERFGFDAVRAAALIRAARTQLDAALDDWVFAAAIRSEFNPEERIEIAKLLWEVVYADAKLSRLEKALMQRLSADIDIDTDALESARALAFSRGPQRGPENIE